MQRRMNGTRRGLVLGGVAVIVIAALVAAYAFSDDDVSDGKNGADGLTPVTLFLPYIPNVQFAPVYVAAQRGYFADEGIAIALENNFNEADGLERLAAGNLRFAIASGEQVLLARGQDRPLVYVYEWYHRFPVGIASPVALDLTEPQDLAGRTIGFPGVYGTSYVGLRALLDGAGMSESDLGELRAIGFTAPENICAGEVEAAVIYVVNEPIAIAQECTPVNVIAVADYANLVANGLLTNEATIRDEPELVRGMVRAIARGVADTMADPDAAFTISVENYVDDLLEDRFAQERQVLENSLALWEADDPGRTDPAAWETTQRILLEAGLLAAPLDDLSAAYDMSFLPAD